MLSGSGSTRRNILTDQRFLIALILLLALVLRLAHVLPRLGIDNSTLRGGDYGWYAQYGRTLVRTGWTLAAPPTGPIFLVVAGIAEELGDPYRPGVAGWLLQRMIGGAIVFPDVIGHGQGLIRLLHAVLGTVTVWFIYRIGRAAWSVRVGLVAALVVAINPLFVIETGNTTTETIALLLMAWAMAIWLERVARADWTLYLPVGILLALAALTRSVFLAFPALLILHLGLLYGWRRMLRGGIMIGLAFLLTTSPWTAYNLITWDRFTISGEGLMGMLYVGAVGWKAPLEVDAELGVDASQADFASRQQAYAEGLAATVLRDPAGYALTRLRELGGALLQPHNTGVFPGESIKQLAAQWLATDRTLSGLVRLAGAEQFWPKLALYAFHYTALLLGLIGLVGSRQDWRRLAPLYGVFAYFLGIHLLLSAIPRYLFPLEMFLCLFGAWVVAGRPAASGVLRSPPLPAGS
jgi:4-amino-4-deoxy-L-arabinose transferase-like glycosyltransferase